MKYRKKPIVVEAIQYDGGGLMLDFFQGDERVESAADGSGACVIYTLEGAMRCNVGDWIIRGVQGELYPCQPDIFKATYEAVG